jgi:SAM-dependent methyltransferase
MKPKDILCRLTGRPTSQERHLAQKNERKALRNLQKKELKDAVKAALAKQATLSPQAERLRLNEEFEAQARKLDFDPRLPHPDINYNHKPRGGYAEYRRDFIHNAVLLQLPSCLEIAGYKADQAEFHMLDYGCGLGRLGFAFTNFFGQRMDRRYFGYEIHPTAREFLQKAYLGWPNVKFCGDNICIKDSYVEIHEGSAQDEGRLDAADVKLGQAIPVKLDLQISFSVFTHMYRKAIVAVLKEIGALMKPSGVCVNSWLVVDDLAEASLRCGLADRALPYESKEEGFLYYMQDNPLMCSAYRLAALQAIYAEAGHEIVDIRWGTWSGRTPTQSFLYQDIVISRPLAR